MHTVTMPSMGADMVEGTIVEWIKSEGDEVKKGDKIAEIQTDKTVLQIESFYEGIIHKILVSTDTTVPVGTPIALIGQPDEKVESLPSDTQVSAQPTTQEQPEPVSEPVETRANTEEKRSPTKIKPPSNVPASPIAKRIAQEHGIDINTVHGTGPRGRVTERDINAFIRGLHHPKADPVVVKIAQEHNIDIDTVKGTGQRGRITEKDIRAFIRGPQPENVDIIAARVAKEHGIDATTIKGTGPRGRVTERDVLAFLRSQQPTTSDESSSKTITSIEPLSDLSDVTTTSSSESKPIKTSKTNTSSGSSTIPLTRMRKSIAKITLQSKTQIPHFYVSRDVTMNSVVYLRKSINNILSDNGDSRKLSINDMVLKACVLSLEKYPKWNSQYQDGQLLQPHNINIGIAVGLDDGVIVPSILNSQNMSLVELSGAARDLTKRARGIGGTLSTEELTQGTFSTSNLGMLGIDSFSAIILPPQSAILAISAIVSKPVVVKGAVIIRDIMNITLSADHRVGDGVEAALFVNEIKNKLEDPLQLLDNIS